MKEITATKFITASIAKVTSTYNLVVGALITALTAVFGVYWYIFLGYFASNILDWLTGWAKARKYKRESSAVGFQGVVKKTGYWVIITVAFMIPHILVPLLNDVMTDFLPNVNVDFSFLFMIGWYTLCVLFINELRSILENMVEMEYYVPEALIKGLAITQKMVNGAVHLPDVSDKETEEAEE